MRMLTSEARVDAHRFRGGFLGEQDYARLVEAFARLHDAKVFIDDTPSVGILEMRRSRADSSSSTASICSSLITCSSCRAAAGSRWQQELASISRALKILAKELHVPRRRSASSAARPRRARITGRSCRTCGSPARSSRMRTSSCSSFARRCTGRKASARRTSKAPPRSSSASSATGQPARSGSRFSSSTTLRESGGRGALRSTGYGVVIRPTVATVSLEALAANLRAVGGLLARQASPPPGIIAVVKANAYGRGAEAMVSIEPLAQPSPTADIEKVSSAGAGCDLAHPRLRRAQRQRPRRRDRLQPHTHRVHAGRGPRWPRSPPGATRCCHLKIDTGMNRLGFRHDNLRRTMPEMLASRHLRIDAVYTHFATADQAESPFLEASARGSTARWRRWVPWA